MPRISLIQANLRSGKGEGVRTVRNDLNMEAQEVVPIQTSFSCSDRMDNLLKPGQAELLLSRQTIDPVCLGAG
jgi:hypothetical protein